MSLENDAGGRSSRGRWRKPFQWTLGAAAIAGGIAAADLTGVRFGQDAIADSPPASPPAAPQVFTEPHSTGMPLILPAVPTYPLAAMPVKVPNGTEEALLPPSAGANTFQPLEFPRVVIDPEGVTPAARLQPAVQPKDAQPLPQPQAQPQPLPPPKRFPPFDDDKIRLPRLGFEGLGSTPVPTPAELEELRKFIKGVIDPRYTLDLIEGRARVVLLNETPTRTQIADPSIATFRLLEPQGKQITIVGARAGTTVLNLWFDDPDKKGEEKILSYLVRVLPDPEARERLEAIYKVLEIEINKAFPKSRVRLTLVGDKLMITGQAHDVADATHILRIISANAPGGAGAAARPPLSSIQPTGNVLDPLRPAQTPGLEQYIPEGSQNVINNLRVPGEQQVSLRVIVAEVNRSAARSIGLDFSIINNRGTTVFAQNTGGLAALANLPVNLDNGQIPIAIRALRTLSYARSLAEPNLVTMNGRPASFLAGGQFPVPVLGGFGNIGAGGGGGLQGVQFVPFGVQLQFVPIITDRDRIRLTVNATVSTRDPSTGTNIGGGGGGGGANVPGLNTRTFSTTIELREGQTMAVAGLMQNNIGADAVRVPLFGDIPYLGRFASIQRTSAGEQELVVLVTPELVHPLEPHELTPLPGADVFEPGDLEFYLAGRLESRRSYDYRSPVMTDIHRMLRYRRCEQAFIVGPSGHVEPPDPDAVPPVGKKDGGWFDVLPAGKK